MLSPIFWIYANYAICRRHIPTNLMYSYSEDQEEYGLSFQATLDIHTDRLPVDREGKCAVFKCCQLLKLKNDGGIIAPDGIHLISLEHFAIIV